MDKLCIFCFMMPMFNKRFHWNPMTHMNVTRRIPNSAAKLIAPPPPLSDLHWLPSCLKSFSQVHFLLPVSPRQPLLSAKQSEVCEQPTPSFALHSLFFSRCVSTHWHFPLMHLLFEGEQVPSEHGCPSSTIGWHPFPLRK